MRYILFLFLFCVHLFMVLTSGPVILLPVIYLTPAHSEYYFALNRHFSLVPNNKLNDQTRQECQSREAPITNDFFRDFTCLFVSLRQKNPDVSIPRHF